MKYDLNFNEPLGNLPPMPGHLIVISIAVALAWGWYCFKTRHAEPTALGILLLFATFAAPIIMSFLY